MQAITYSKDKNLELCDFEVLQQIEIIEQFENYYFHTFKRKEIESSLVSNFKQLQSV